MVLNGDDDQEEEEDVNVPAVGFQQGRLFFVCPLHVFLQVRVQGIHPPFTNLCMYVSMYVCNRHQPMDLSIIHSLVASISTLFKGRHLLPTY